MSEQEPTGTGRQAIAWLFFGVLTILAGHMAYMGLHLGICYTVVHREARILMDQQERIAKLAPAPDGKQRRPPEPPRWPYTVCEELSARFNEARDSGIDILLALLVPSGALMASASKKPPGGPSEDP